MLTRTYAGAFADRHTGKETLRRLLADRAALLILDDVWTREDAEASNVAGPRGRLLLITRDAGLVTALAARENHYRVELPSLAEAQAILAAAADVAHEALPPEAHDIIAHTGRLPLALALCGGTVRAGTPWRHVLEALQEHDLVVRSVLIRLAPKPCVYGEFSHRARPYLAAEEETPAVEVVHGRISKLLWDEHFCMGANQISTVRSTNTDTK